MSNKKHNYKGYYSKQKEETSEQLQLFPIEPEVTEEETNIEPEVTEEEIQNEPFVRVIPDLSLVRVIPNLLNVRFEAEKDAMIVTVVSQDDELILLDKESINGFYHILTKTGIEGYCMVEFVELV